MSVVKDIFLVNNGLTCNDVYDKTIEFYRHKKKEGKVLEKEHLEILKKGKRDRNNKLSLNGIVEARELKKDDKMNSLKKGNNYFYTLCDRVSIETALIYLNKERPFFKLIVLPFIKFEKGIKKASDITDFKNSFGLRNNNNMKNYWNIKENIIDIRKSMYIDWNLVDNLEFSKIRNYNINNLLSDILNKRFRVHNIDKFILFCNTKIIKEFLKKIKDTKFKPDSKMKIFNTHCFHLKFNQNQGSSELKLAEFNTFYPQKLGNTNIKYEFEGKKYDLLFEYYSRKMLINKFNIIPYCRCLESEKINEIINILNKRKNNKVSSSKNIDNVNDFNNLFKKINHIKKIEK